MKNIAKLNSALRLYFVLLFILFSNYADGQKRNNIWCFGDSAGVDFNNITNPINFTSSLRTRGTCISIADTSGNLLFYGNTVAGVTGNTGHIWSFDHQLMQNGDSLVGQGWYQEMLIIPVFDSSQIYYVFTKGLTGGSSQNGFYYSIIDMNQNGGLGEVIQKNIFLTGADLVDGLTAVKHGNGRDWWVITHNWNNQNKFFKYLITPSGINGPYFQQIGTYYHTDVLKFKFSPGGNKLLAINYLSLIEIFDFDRCTGTLSNSITISPESFSNVKKYFGCSFSPNGQLIYVSNTDNIFGGYLRLLQYNLLAPDIIASKKNIYFSQVPASGGMHLLAPDGKIYISCLYEYGFPYSDSIHNMYSDNLSVINYPDSLGAACDFQPFSFYLGGHRTYWGLPNNPDYDMGALSGSPCDTLTDVQTTPFQESEPKLFLFYHSGWQKLFVNAQNIKGKNCLFQMFDINGRKVYSSTKPTQPPYFTEEVNIGNLSKGMYLVNLTTEKENLVKKFIKK